MDWNSVAARLLVSAAIAVMAFVCGALSGRILARRHPDDPYGSYYARKIGRYGAGLITLIALPIVWRAFAGRLSVVFGLLAAALAFAMQEVIGALAGWFPNPSRASLPGADTHTPGGGSRPDPAAPPVRT